MFYRDNQMKNKIFKQKTFKICFSKRTIQWKILKSKIITYNKKNKNYKPIINKCCKKIRTNNNKLKI